MTQETTAPVKKVYKPRPTVNSFQTSFMLGIMRAKGYASQDYILKIVAAISSAKTFSDMSFDEARYLVLRLPNVTRAKLDAFMAGTIARSEVGLPLYDPHYGKAFGKRNSKGGKA
jgi:hypothetical protein